MTLVEGHVSFKRGVLLKAMKSATSYYKQGYPQRVLEVLGHRRVESFHGAATDEADFKVSGVFEGRKLAR